MAKDNLDFNKLITALSTHLQTMGAAGKQISPYSGLDLTPTPTVYEQENGMDRSGPLRRLRQMDNSRPDATGTGMNDPKAVMEMLATVMHLQNAQQEGVATTDLRNAQSKEIASKSASRDNEESFAKALGFPNMDTYRLVQQHIDQQNKLNLSQDALKERRTASLHNLIQSAGMLPGGEHIAKAALEQLANESGVKVAPSGVDPTNQKLAQRAAGRGVPVAASAVNPPAASPAPATGTTPAAPTNAMDISRLANTPAIPPTPSLYPAVADQARMLGQPAGSFTPAVFNPAGPTPANLVANPAFDPAAAAAKLNPTPTLDMSSLVVPAPAPVMATNVNGMGLPRSVVPPDKNALLAILANMNNNGQQARRDKNNLLSVY